MMRIQALAICSAVLFLSLSSDILAAVGRIATQFSVTPFGTADYTVPIWTPPGINGLQPQLALNYDSSHSRQTSGILGPGWNLSGFSAISRCNRTYAQDTVPSAVTLTMTDAFCLDGERLRLSGTQALATYGQPSTTYETELANFSLVTASSTSLGNGPAYFTVQGRNGWYYEYGNTADSAIIPSGSTTPYVWALDKVTDRYGNTMKYTYSYSSVNGSYVPLTIQYAAVSGSNSYPYEVSFAYNTKILTDAFKFELAGTFVQLTQQLATITVTSGGSAVRQYDLTYSLSPTTSRQTLTSIAECGLNPANGALDDCLSGITVGYQGGGYGVANPTSATGGDANGGGPYSVDVNGDGKMDLVYGVKNGTNVDWWVQLATTTGYSAAINTGAVTSQYKNILLDNFDATRETEILAPVGTVWYLYKYNGSSFTATSTGASVNASALYFASADVDGDGRPDLVFVTGPTSISVQLNTASGGAVSFAAAVSSALPVPPTASIEGLYGNNMLQNSPLKHYDFDGDGRDDLVLHYFFSPHGFATDPYVALLSRGTSGFEIGTQIWNATGADPSAPIEVIHFNDDACADMVRDQTIAISQCNGGFATTLTLPTSASLALDWDGDGRTDILSNVGGVWTVYYSQASEFSLGTVTGIPVGTGEWVVTDQNGDGLDDLVFANFANSSGALAYGLHAGANQPADLATSFSDGFGNSIRPTYQSLVQGSYELFSNGALPYVDYIGPMYVATSVKYSDPSSEPTGSYSQTYFYEGAWMNLQGRGFAGFQAIAIQDLRNDLWETLVYDLSFPYTGLVTQDVISEQNTEAGTLSNQRTTLGLSTLASTANNQVYFPYASNVSTYTYEVGGSKNGELITTTDVNYGSPDNYGNFNFVTTTVTDNDGTSPASQYYGDSWVSTTANTITPNTSTWCLNLPTETTVTNSIVAPGGAPIAGGAAITRTIQYNSPDYTHCRETERVIEPSSTTYKVVEDYGYDAYGNLHTDSVTGVGMSPRTTTITWNSTGQFPQTVQDAMGETVTLGFDPNTGMKTSETDPSSTTSNPIVTTWGYDDLARKAKVTNPDGTYSTWSYDACSASGCVNSNNQMTITTTNFNVGGTTRSVSNVYTDSLDRPLVTSKQMLSGAFDRREVQYDSFGRVHLQGAPCTFVSCATYWTTNTYDDLNRLTLSKRPISATNNSLQSTTYGYAGRTATIQDPLGNTTTRVSLVTGALAKVTDPKGYAVAMAYDAFGSLLSTTDHASPANVLSTATYSYGLTAFKTASTDMDRGGWSYTVDALGETTKWSDAKKQTFSMTYDALSRPRVRTEPDLTTTWTWGNTPASHNVGKLQSITGSSSVGTYSDSYTFDSLGRVSSEVISNPGDRSYTYVKTYNPTTGLPASLQYPVDISFILTLQYAYSYGLLQSVSSNSFSPSVVYWSAGANNPRGQITTETFGNGVVKANTYDAVTGWLTKVQAGVGTGAALQNNSYTYDYDGNVIERQDNNQGLTENFYYDSLNRLDHSTLNGNLNLQMTYDTTGMGNIASRSDVAAGAAWTYDPVRKHAVIEAGSGASTYTYDANGNASTRNGSTVGWTSANYPVSVSTGTESVQFAYDAHRQRWQEIYTGGPNGIETTYHAGKLFEVANYGGLANYRHYVYAGNELVAVDNRTTSSTTQSYVISDHQGSFAALETGSNPGTNDVKESFTAFGNRRNGETWSGPPTSADESAINVVSRRGYTGEGVLGISMGLNHLNGRIEDAVIGRFISPDPIVQDPGNTQSFNRYSYVLNNPLSRIDPSGFVSCTGQPSSLDCPPGQSGTGGSGGGGSGNGSQPTQTPPATAATAAPYNPFGVPWYIANDPDATIYYMNGSVLDGGFGMTFANGTFVSIGALSGQPISGSGYWGSIPGETHTIELDNGISLPWYQDGQFLNSADPNGLGDITVTAHPYNWINTAGTQCSDCAVDLYAFGQALAPYNPLRASITLGVGTALVGAGIAATPAAGAWIANHGPQVALGLQIAAKAINAVNEDSEVISEAQKELAQNLERAEAAQRAQELSVPEVSGPEEPWGP